MEDDSVKQTRMNKFMNKQKQGKGTLEMNDTFNFINKEPLYTIKTQTISLHPKKIEANPEKENISTNTPSQIPNIPKDYKKIYEKQKELDKIQNTTEYTKLLCLFIISFLSVKSLSSFALSSL